MFVFLLLLCLADGVVSQIRYSVPEEADQGTFVGNIAEDLGLDLTKLTSRRFQVVPSSRTPYLEVNLENGVLFVNEKIDRERICKQSASCLLHLEVFLENPLELFRVEIEVVDINDNPPSFPETDITVEISESATPGTRFPLESAFDPDVGSNALRTYDITNNNNFYLDVQTQTDGNKFAELVLEKPLDREQQAMHRYVLTAVDGGQPPRTGTALLVVRVLDSNDNVPVFDQPVYSVNLAENAPVGTLVIQLNATDSDEGPNGEVIYSFSNHISSRVKELFDVDARTGRIEVRGEVDFEESSLYQIYVQAKDMGPNAVPAHCKVLVKVTDVNDNAPEIIFSTVTESVSENAATGTVIALLSVTDKDSEDNGQTHLEILGDVPFKLKTSFRNYYTIVTDGPLNRETVEAYTVTVVARDKGISSLATSKSIKVHVSDENDNAPTFTQPIYDVYVTENNVPGAYIYAVSAVDPDVGQNAYITYSIVECEIQGMSVVTYVSINSENGYLYALRSFDYEQLKDFSFMVQARDSGSPELWSNATVNVIIVDQNDNAPSVIAPLGKNGTAREPLPRSAEPGYLVTRIVAMDADDGENARLSYSIQRGNENGMFRMDWRTGELRTARRVSVKRDPQQLYELLIEVRDHGQPPMSCSAVVQVTLVDSLVEGHSGDAARPRPKKRLWTWRSSSSLLLVPFPSSSSWLWLCWLCAVRRIKSWTSTTPAWPATAAAWWAAGRAGQAVAAVVRPGPPGKRRSWASQTSCWSRAPTQPTRTWRAPRRCLWRSQGASDHFIKVRTTATRSVWLRNQLKRTSCSWRHAARRAATTPSTNLAEPLWPATRTNSSRTSYLTAACSPARYEHLLKEYNYLPNNCFQCFVWDWLMALRKQV